MDLQAAFEVADAQQDRLIERIRRVIAIDTTVPPGRNYDRVIDAVEPEFQQFGFKTERVIIPEELWRAIPLPLEGERVNLVATKGNGSKPPLSIYAHTDVVPIEEGWSHPPFGGEIEEERIYGRGTADMKGTIATLLTALDIMHQQNIEPAWDITVCLCTDEEIGVYPGLWHLAKHGYVKMPMLCMEGGQDPNVWLGANGAVDVTITAIGKSCHSGANYLGVNAIEELVPIMNELLVLKREVEQRRSKLPLAPSPGAPSHLSPMFNLDIIHAGVKSNIVPATCTLVVNRRYIPEENFDDVVGEIQEAIQRGKEKSKLLDVKVDIMHVYPAYTQSADHSAAVRLREAMKLVQGYKDEDFVYTGVGGSTDMAFLAQTMNSDEIAAAGVGRRNESKAHGADESIRISDAVAHVKELIYFLAKPHD